MQQKPTDMVSYTKLPPGWTMVSPVGTLEIVTAEIKQGGNIIGPSIIAVDAAGVTWKLDNVNFVFDMRGAYHALPPVFPALYHVSYNLLLSEYYETDSPEKALAEFIARRPYYATQAKVLGVYVRSD